jgi:hypothetical protein
MRAERPILLRFLNVLTSLNGFIIKRIVFLFFRIHTTSVELERYACVLRLLSMKETCQNLVRSVVQREDLQIEKENTGKENRMLNC